MKKEGHLNTHGFEGRTLVSRVNHATETWEKRMGSSAREERQNEQPSQVTISSTSPPKSPKDRDPQVTLERIVNETSREKTTKLLKLLKDEGKLQENLCSPSSFTFAIAFLDLKHSQPSPPNLSFVSIQMLVRVCSNIWCV